MNLNNLYPERTYQDLKRLVPYAGKTFYEYCPEHPREYRTVYMRWDAFNNKVHPMFSNYVEGNPPEGMEQLNPKLLAAVMRMNQQTSSAFH